MHVDVILCCGSVLYDISPSLRWAEDLNEVVPVAVVKLGVSHVETMHNKWISIVLLFTKLNCSHVVQSKLKKENNKIR